MEPDIRDNPLALSGEVGLGAASALALVVLDCRVAVVESAEEAADGSEGGEGSRPSPQGLAWALARSQKSPRRPKGRSDRYETRKRTPITVYMVHYRLDCICFSFVMP